MLNDYSTFRNTENISFLIVDEPFIISLYDPKRGKGCYVGDRKISPEELAINQHLFFYGYNKKNAEEHITANAKEWARIYASFNAGSFDQQTQTRPHTFISIAGAMSKKPSFHNVIKHILDKIIRDHAPDCFSWTDNMPIPSDDAIEQLAKWMAYQELEKNESDIYTKLMYQVEREKYKAQFVTLLSKDVHDSLFGSSIALCLYKYGVKTFKEMWNLLWKGDYEINIVPSMESFLSIEKDPVSGIETYLDSVSYNKVEFLQPYDILFREFRNSNVKIDGVLTHTYSLRDSLICEPDSQGCEDIIDIYSGFYFQGNRVSDISPIYYGPGNNQLYFENNKDLFTFISRPTGLSAITKVIQTVKDNMESNGYEHTPLYFTYQCAGSGSGEGAIYEFGATDPRNVNSAEIRAMINVAYLSGANGAFGWTDYFTNNAEVNSGLFNHGTTEPAIGDDGVPRLEGVMRGNDDVMDCENYLNWHIGTNRTIRIISEYLKDDFWVIKFKFEEKPSSEFWAVMNRKISVEPREYKPSGPRLFSLSIGDPKYLRECKFPAPPILATETSSVVTLSPGEFRMFEASDVALTDARYNTIYRATTPQYLFRGQQNSVQIDFTPEGITPNYIVRVYLKNGMNRIFFHEAEFSTTGPQMFTFCASVPPDWPFLGNKILLCIEKPGVMHQETYEFKVDILVDTDGDGIGDNADTDDDDDGMPDEWEKKYDGLDPLVDDAAGHIDDDGLSNLEEYQCNTDPTLRDTDGDGVNDKDDIFPLDRLRWTHDITPMIELLLLGPVASTTVIGRDQINFDITLIYDPTFKTCGCTPENDFVGKFSFEATLKNKGSTPLSGLMVEVTDLENIENGKRENRLILPDGNMGGVGAMFPIPRKDEYLDGVLRTGDFVTVHFDLCLGSWNPFFFYVNVLGIVE